MADLLGIQTMKFREKIRNKNYSSQILWVHWALMLKHDLQFSAARMEMGRIVQMKHSNTHVWWHLYAVAELGQNHRGVMSIPTSK